MYILSLAASDILVAVLCVPYTFVVFVCKLQPQISEDRLQSVFYMVCDMVPSILSIYALALVAVDRAMAISKPFWHLKYVNNKRAFASVIIMWIFVFGLVSFLFVIDDNVHFTLFIIIMAYVVPVTIMVVCYVVMGIIAKHHSKELTSLEKTRTRLMRNDSGRKEPGHHSSHSEAKQTVVKYDEQQDKVSSIPLLIETSNGSGDESRDRLCTSTSFLDNNNNNSKINSHLAKDNPRRLHRQNSWFKSSMFQFSVARIRTRSSSIANGIRALKRELKAALTLSLILGCFILSWTPFIGLNIEYFRCPECPVNFDLIKYFKMLHFTNSALNPLLFILLNKRWRSAFFKVVLRRKTRHGTTHSMVSESSTTTVTSAW